MHQASPIVGAELRELVVERIRTLLLSYAQLAQRIGEAVVIVRAGVGVAL
jgi:Na+/citrate or Na+/malate symporter